MSIKLDPWQQEVCDYDGDLLLCTGRRSGKTYTLARKAIDRMSRNPGTPIVMVSLTEDQAMIIMSMALDYARETYPHLIGKGENKPTLKSLHLNGGKMIVRPVGSTGDGARGFAGGVLIVDEASRMPRMFWIAAKPILLTTNGQIWMGSTPAGKDGYFWDKYDEVINKKDPDARFKVFSISSIDAMTNRKISENWTEQQREGALRVLKEDEKEMTKKEFMQEYLGQFVDEIYSFFPRELVEKACIIKDREPCKEIGENFLGIDVGGMGSDPSILLSVRRIKKKKIRQIDMEKTEHTRTTQTTTQIKFSDAKWGHKKIYIDNGGIGIGIFDTLLEDRQTKNKIIGINNASKNLDIEDKKHKSIMKEDLYMNLLRLLEQGSLELYDEPEIMMSFLSITCEYKDGKMLFWSRKAHIVEALGRACWCMKDKSLNIYIEFG